MMTEGSALRCSFISVSAFSSAGSFSNLNMVGLHVSLLARALDIEMFPLAPLSAPYLELNFLR